MEGLTFDPDLHQYRLDGRFLPSVTFILREMGFIDTSFFTEEARERGTHVHRLTELHDLGTLEPKSVNPRIAGYLEGWKSFCRKMNYGWVAIEEPICQRTYLYAGTPDRVGISGKGVRGLIDIKTGPPASWHGYQIGAYCLAVEPRVREAFSVHLAADGSYRVEEYDIGERIEDWKAINRTYQLRGLK